MQIMQSRNDQEAYIAAIDCGLKYDCLDCASLCHSILVAARYYLAFDRNLFNCVGSSWTRVLVSIVQTVQPFSKIVKFLAFSIRETLRIASGNKALE